MNDTTYFPAAPAQSAMHNETIPAPLLHHGPDRNQEPPSRQQEPSSESAIVIKVVAGALIILMFLVSLLR